MPRPKKDAKEALALGDKVSKKGKNKKPPADKTPAKTDTKPQVTRAIPPPIYLGNTAKQVWRSELPKLNLHPAKLPLFAGYCSHLGRAIDFEKEIKKKGTHKDNANNTMSKHMEVNAAEKEWKAAMSLATKLGITGLMGQPPKNEDNTTIEKNAPGKVVDEEDEFILGGARPAPR